VLLIYLHPANGAIIVFALIPADIIEAEFANSVVVAADHHRLPRLLIVVVPANYAFEH
jgi:hypothetical protein